MAAAACGETLEETSSPPQEARVVPEAVRRAVQPLRSAFDCQTPTDGLVLGHLQHTDTATSVSGVASRAWSMAVHQRLLAQPLTAGCEAGGVMAALPGDSSGIVAVAIRQSAAWLGEAADYVEDYGPITLPQASQLLCADEAVGCPSEGVLPDPLATDVARILVRAHAAIQAELARRTYAGARAVAHWADHGGDGLLAAPAGAGFDPTFAADRAYIDASFVDVFETAAALAEEIAAIDWRGYADLRGVSWRLDTPYGPAIVQDAADHHHDYAEAPLLLIDLGGADTYEGQAGGSSAARPVAVVIDLGGADVHGYAGIDARRAATSTAAPLARDADGDWTGDRFVAASISAASRQGAARTGTALWFDLGDDDDVYVSLRASQGYAHHGVGVLFDAGGRDVYRVEAAGQGVGQFGIGLLVDAGQGDDQYFAEYVAQGHGYTRGVGALIDAGGSDAYACAPQGGRYPAPQADGLQVSLCQGVGFGYRDRSDTHAMPGGLGVLLDHSGDDQYEAGVYAQGAGLAEGVGMLLDGAGDDRYDAQWHAIGAGVHGGAGLFFDRGAGRDIYGAAQRGRHVLMGAGHDRGVGVFVDDGGDDYYALTSMSVGAGTCGSVAIFIDELGDDVYVGHGSHALGHFDDSVCGQGLGLMVDAGGRDSYPEQADAVEQSAWQCGAGGYGLDGEGPSGLVTTVGNIP